MKTKNYDVEKSAVAQQSSLTKRGIVFEDTKLLGSIPLHYTSKMREA